MQIFYVMHHYSRLLLLHWLIDWLYMYGLTSLSRFFFYLYREVTIAGEGLQNLVLCSALRAFEQGWIFIMPHLLWHGTSVFPFSPEGPPHLVASYDTRGDLEDLFDLDITVVRTSDYETKDPRSIPSLLQSISCLPSAICRKKYLGLLYAIWRHNVKWCRVRHTPQQDSPFIYS
jgi:hypothetical protein